MRKAIGIFGALAGATVVGLVARYGFVTSDTAIDGAIVAFFFAVIAIGGIAGPAVAVHLYRGTSGAAKFWGIAAAVVAAVALLANLTNSLGAIAGRADKTAAQRTAAINSVKDDRAELARLDRLIATLPALAPTDKVAVLAAQRAADTATTARKAECGNGDPRERGKNCRAYEAAEREALSTLTATTANRAATTERAANLEAEAAAIRARLKNVPPVKSANPLADALGRIFAVPADVAATGQQIATVVVVELLIAFSLIAFELLGAGNALGARAPSMAGPQAGIELEPPALSQRPAGGILALAGITATDLPRMIAADATSVPRFMISCLPRAVGEQVSWGRAYARYQRWCGEQQPPLAPLAIEPFGEAFRAYCARANIPTQRAGSKLFAVGVRLAS